MRNLSLLISFAFFLPLFLNGQVPSGGILLNSSTGTTYQQIGSCSLTEVPVSGQDFTTALRISVDAAVSNTWDAQVRFPAVEGIQSGDIVLVAFYGRTIYSEDESGQGKAVACIEMNSSPFTKEIYYTIAIGQDWKEYYAPVEITNARDAASVNYSLHLGFASQVIEIADVRFLNYKQNLTLEEMPQTEISYSGQSPDAAWRAPAAERIDLYRKGPVEIEIYDQDGQALPDAEISIEMLQHEFGFGTAIVAAEFNSNATYRNKVFEIFNEVVFENDLKWPQFNISNTANITRALDSLDAHQIPVRGHNIIWPSWDLTPDFLEGLKDDTIALRNAIDARIDQATGFAKGRLNDWDVMNEPYTNHDIQDVLGNQSMTDWYMRAREKDRAVKLYINEYSIISAGGKNTTKQDYYFNLIQEIEAGGGEIDGIGMQGHMGTDLTPITLVYDIVDRFAGLGKEIKITEHDINTTQRGVQADYTRDFMTILFSHPAVKSLLVWGFWENRHWLPDGAFFNADWSIRPNGEAWIDMIYNQWWTPSVDTVSDASGNYSFEGFLGKYKYTVSNGITSRTGYFRVEKNNNDGEINRIVISLDDNLPEKPVIESNVSGYLCSGETATLSLPLIDGASYAWYRDGELLTEEGSGITTDIQGNYTAEITKSGISLSSQPYFLKMRTAPQALMDREGSITICGGGSLTMNAAEVEGAEYRWFRNSIQVLSKTTTLETGLTGSYVLQASANGCYTNSAEATIFTEEQPQSVITPFSETSFCEGGSVMMGGPYDLRYSYNWFLNGEPLDYNDIYLDANQSGSYTLETSIGECTGISAPVEVTVTPYPEAIISLDGETEICEGENITLIASQGDNYLYSWMKNGIQLSETGPSLLVSESGNYSLTVSDSDCSSNSEPVEINVLSPSNPSCLNTVIEDEITYRAWPNPFSGSFSLDCGPANTDPLRILIYNDHGQLLRIIEDFAGPGTIELPDPGLYFLKIFNESSFRILKLTSI